MIVLDGSALFAILLGEPDAESCEAAIEHAETLLLSAGSLAEILIVASGKGVLDLMRAFIDALDPTIVDLTAERARASAQADGVYGKGFHPAALNLGDSFAYALAKEHGCPLLYIGNDFARTDIISAL